MRVFVATANVIREGGWVIGVGVTEDAGKAIAARYVADDATNNGTLGAWEYVPAEVGRFASADVGDGRYMFMKVEAFEVGEAAQ